MACLPKSLRREYVLKMLIDEEKKEEIEEIAVSHGGACYWLNAKTKVINSCLNPVWNEEMSFSIEEPAEVIKFEVFDWDRFKYDDKMGHAFLELQPVAAAAKLRRALRLTTGLTKLRKVAASVDNCLHCDSFVTYSNGEIMLDARLRLRDVESGELFVTVKWIEADGK